MRSLSIESLLATCLLACSLGCDGSAKLEVTPSELNYGTIAGDAHMNITIKNTGDSGILWNEQELLYNVSATEDWLTVCSNDTLSLSPDDSYACEVWVDRSGLQQGKNNGWVRVRSNGGDAEVVVLVWRNDTVDAK